MSDSSYERDRFFIVFRLPSGNDCINLNDPLSGLFFALSTLPVASPFCCMSGIRILHSGACLSFRITS